MWRCPSCSRPVSFADPRHPWPSGWACDACGFAPTWRDAIPCFAPNLVDTLTGFDPDLFNILVRYEESSFWFVNRAALINSFLKSHFPDARDVLEIGCGTGSVLLAMHRANPQLRLVGSELHPRGLTFARERLGSAAALLQMDARDIPVNSMFDVVGAFDVLEHIAEDEAVMRQMHDALKPGGGAIITVPQHPWLWSPTDEDELHKRRYARGELEAKLEKAGFSVERSTSFNSLLLPLMIASRQMLIWQRARGAKREMLSEFQMAAWTNTLLSAVLRLEVGLTIAGVRWPVGGSRFVVAKRK